MIRSDRNVPVSGHVTQTVREELERIQRTGTSISKFVSEAIEEKIARLRSGQKEEAAA